MIVIEWLAGERGHLAASASASTILILMFFMTVMLRRLNRRNGAYRLLGIGIMAAIVPLFWQPATGGTAIALDGLSLASFLMISFAVLELYTPARFLDRLLLVLFLLGAGGVSWLQWTLAAPAHDNISNVASAVMLQPLGIASLVSASLALSLILPRIGQKSKFATSLAVFAAGELASAAHAASAIGQLWLDAVAVLLPVAYYVILFTLLFERVIERMQSVYVSSIRDGLTGLFLRRHFLKKANRYASRGLIVSVLFCDIDNFKKLNDTQGHHKADLALQKVAEIVSSEVAGSGTAGRYGGEEIVAAVARPGANPADIAETIRARVEAETVVTLSIGWSVAADGTSVEEALKQADEAMYVSKTTGKNKVTAHKPSRTTAAKASI